MVVISVLLIVGAFACSFLGMGILWIGVNQLSQIITALLLFALGFAGGKRGTLRQVLLPIFIGLLPLSSLLVQFRDKEGSHLASIGIALLWLLAAGAGAIVGATRRAKLS